MTMIQEENLSIEARLVIEALQIQAKVQLDRIEELEKELRKIKYTILVAVFALQSILPNGLSSIIGILEKIR